MAGTVLWRWILQNLTDKIVWDDYKAIKGERVNSVFSVAHASKYWQALVQNQIRKSKTKTWAVLVFADYQVQFPFPKLSLKKGLTLLIWLTCYIPRQNKCVCCPSLFLIPQWPLLASLYLSEVWTFTLKTLKQWRVGSFRFFLHSNTYSWSILHLYLHVCKHRLFRSWVFSSFSIFTASSYISWADFTSLILEWPRYIQAYAILVH